MSREYEALSRPCKCTSTLYTRVRATALNTVTSQVRLMLVSLHTHSHGENITIYRCIQYVSPFETYYTSPLADIPIPTTARLPCASGYYIVQRFDMEEACGQYCEESWKDNLYAISAQTSRC